MNLVAVEAPAARVTLTREPLELLDAALGIVPASDGLQVVANHLIEALAKGLGLPSGTSDQLVFDREGDIH